MAKLLKVKGSTSVILEIFVQDSSSTTGAGLTGLVFNSASLTCYYHRNTAAAGVAVSLVDMTVGTFTSSGFKEVSSANMPGVYQLCLPDAAFATGADSVSAILKGATNMAPVALEVQLTGLDLSVALPTNFATLVIDGSGRVDVSKVGGTTQTARDIGASVLLSPGTGTGQLDFTSGVVKANLVQILATALTETSGQIAAAFKKFFDKATPTGTINSIPDAVAGAAGGLVIAGSNAAITANITGNITGNLSGSVGSVTGSVGSIATGGIVAASFAAGAIDNAAIATDAIGSAELAASAVTEIQVGLSTLDAAGIRTAVGLASANLDTQIAAIQSDTDNIQTRLPAALVSGRIDASVGAMATDTLTAAALAADAVTEIQSGVSTLTAAGVRTAVGLASANLDTQLGTIDDFLDTEVAAIKAKTDLIPAVPAAVSDIPTATQNADALLDRNMATGTDSGSASVRTVRQALRFLRNKWDAPGGALSVRKEDDTTVSWTSTLTTNASADPITGSDPA